MAPQGRPPNRENFLEPKTATERDATQLPLPTTKTAACQLKFAEAKFKDLDNQTIFVDTGAGVNRPTSALGHSPCIIRARGPIGFWISNRRRRMNVHECARFQGIPDGTFDLKALNVSNTAYGHALGNAMSVPVLGKIIQALARAAGLAADPS